MKKLLVATGNTHKTEEIQTILGSEYEVTDLRSQPHLPKVEETGTTFLENATLKAVEISRSVAGLVISDDSGLEVDALDGAPGVYSARYAGEEGNDALNNEKLLKELRNTDLSDRGARFRCVIVIAKNGESLAHFDGYVEGHIISELHGDGGFGYDPLFVPKGHQSSFAELGEEIKNTLSHRAQAMEKVQAWLSSSH